MPSINVALTEEELEQMKKCKPEGFSWKRFLTASCWIMGRRASSPRKEWGKNWGFPEPIEITKPCHACGFCPYGQVVEMFPFSNEYSCRTFGHDCPVFWLAEPITEPGTRNLRWGQMKVGYTLPEPSDQDNQDHEIMDR